MITKDALCLSETSGWFDACFFYLGTSVQPPPKTLDYDNFTLCLFVNNVEGGLTPSHDLTK